MSVIEILDMIYTIIPQEIILIILGCLAMGIMLQYEDYKNRKQNGTEEEQEQEQGRRRHS